MMVEANRAVKLHLGRYTTYQSFGLAGFNTPGVGRDLDQVKKVGYPVFTGRTISAHGCCHTPYVLVRVGGVMIYLDDLVQADVNGVTTIPHEIAVEVAEIGDGCVVAEAPILDTLHQYGADACRLKAARLESKRQMGVLRIQVSRKQ